MSSGDQKPDHHRRPELRQLRSTYAAVEHEILTLLFLLLLLPAIPFAGAQSNPDNNRNDPYQYNQFTPSMAIIIVVLVAALFFMGFVSIYIRHCNDGQSTGNSVRVIGGAGRSRRPRGLDRTVIDSFPTFVYSSVKGHKIGKGALECAVCLNEFEEEDTLRLIPKCDHVFHPECVDAWLENHTTCPVCRAQLSPQPDEVVQPDGSPVGSSADVEAQNDDVTLEPGVEVEQREGDEQQLVSETEPEVLDLRAKLNRNRTRGSRSSRTRRFFFPRSHTTGHSLVQPGENLDRFTLKLPVEVRKQILNRKLHRATSLVVLPREGSSRLGYRNGGDGGSNRGSRSSKRLDSSVSKSDRWVFSMTPPFFMRMSSLKSPKVAATDDHGEGTSSAQTVLSGVLRSDSVRPPV